MLVEDGARERLRRYRNVGEVVIRVYLLDGDSLDLFGVYSFSEYTIIA